jgi:hypothetical protein
MDATELSENEVEIYIMKAISKGLVRGRIDQVSKKVCMTWVQPRVLEIPQVSEWQIFYSLIMILPVLTGRLIKYFLIDQYHDLSPG